MNIVFMNQERGLQQKLAATSRIRGIRKKLLDRGIGTVALKS
jgi:hypothetical protein